MNKIDSTIRAKRVVVTDKQITVRFADRRVISVPTTWYPRLLHATAPQRAQVEIWDDGIYWPQLNADVSYRALLLGEKSGESSKSFRRWLGYHRRGEREPILTLPLGPGLSRAQKRSSRHSSRKLVKSAG
jgi:hypothetical protein